MLLWDDALQYALKKNFSGTWGIYHNRGAAYLRQELYPQALHDLNESIRLNPSGNSQAYNDRAVAYAKTGKYSQALADYTMAIDLNPGYYNPYLGRAWVYEMMGDPIAAMRDYAKSCQMGVTEVCDKAQME